MAKRAPTGSGGGLFGDARPELKHVAAHQANIDGGSRGNPGPAAYGVVIRDGKGEIVARLKKYIGQNTNNVAEYFGLIAALDYAQTRGIRALRVESDSELMVKQMRGQYKVKSEDLKPLFERAKKMSLTLESFRIDHVYREQNREADALVNQALDETSRAGSNATAEKPAAKESTIRLVARCKDGLLQPREPLNLPDGTEVEILLRLRK
ncbi:MAG: ribonuclease HI family protein [Candidatus Acidiferrum sp.]